MSQEAICNPLKKQNGGKIQPICLLWSFREAYKFILSLVTGNKRAGKIDRDIKNRKSERFYVATDDTVLMAGNPPAP